jgi:protein involved in polysaccharide export with SLBB domain
MRLHDLLTPDQLTIEAHVDRAELVRTDPVTFQSRVISFSPKALFEGNQAEDHLLHRLDQVVLSSQKRAPNLVSVEGEVTRPGYFTIEFGERLSSVLRRAGGFSPNAFPTGIVLIRESVKEKQTKELERFVAAQKQQLTAQSAGAAGGAVSVAGGGAATGTGSIAEQQVLAIRLQHLESIAERVELGRVVVRLESLESLEGTEDDLRLEAHDIIKIPSPPQTVNIIGSVRNPTTVAYRPGLKVADYIRQAGGESADASKGEMYVVRANGTTEAGYLALKEIGLGDTIVVPQKIEITTPPVALWSTVASVFSSLLIAVTALTVIGR